MIAVDADACPDDAVDDPGGLLLVEDIPRERNLVGVMKILSQ